VVCEQNGAAYIQHKMESNILVKTTFVGERRKINCLTLNCRVTKMLVFPVGPTNGLFTDLELH